jgi:undecaprenyl diphosphate synthase
LNQKIPRHVAIVMDGNGRWAKNRGLSRSEGHREGVNVVKSVIKVCLQKKIGVLSLFAFSSENWSRPANEVDFLMELFIHALGTEIEELHQHGVCLRFTGDRSQLSPSLCKAMQNAEALTGNNQQLILNVAMSYGGRWDIVQASKALAQLVAEGDLLIEEIDDLKFASLLNTHGLPDPDLFIRTSGEQRISNFFLWQLAYAELYFSELLWPDFSSVEFERALTAFSLRQRRYGRTIEKK